ncbi:uncharacterized protein BXZ73DRAFT_77966 [Epithele typhae]|uniref:uncharacterized protein n=1 Tax=Epithele typhae TaxID=378194 RepID=UPI0020085C52|nr:uncharacterized protein BXZ73DRAFT_77966 [Epithele typhae]KAH9930539.1 hypothetical protein BXZ73DRAFT_77966 [Epithele typhae]
MTSKVQIRWMRCHLWQLVGRQSIWLRMAKACGDTPLVSLEHVKDAIKTSGCHRCFRVAQSLEAAVSNTPSDVNTLLLLDELENLEDEHSSRAETKKWVKAQRLKRFSALRIPSNDEAAPLIQQALTYGKLKLVQNTVLPQIMRLADSSTLLRHTTYMHSADKIPKKARTNSAKELLAKAVGRGATDEAQQNEADGTRRDTCFDLDREDLLASVFEKLLKFEGLEKDVLLRRHQQVLLPLVTYIAEILKGHQTGRTPPSGLQGFCEVVVAQYMVAVTGAVAGFQAEDVERLIETADLSGKPDILHASVLPGLEGLELSPSQLEGFLLQLGRCAVGRDGPTTDAFGALQQRLLKKWSSTVELVSTERSYYSKSAKPFLDALEFCLTHSYPDAGAHIVQRLTHPLPTTLTAADIRSTLAPLIPKVHDLLRKYELSPAAPPYAAFFRALALHFAQTVLGPRPRDPAPQIAALARWKCKCEHCAAARDFLTAPGTHYYRNDKELTRIGRPTASTLRAASHLGQTSRDTNPHSFRMNKKPLLVQHEEWMATQQEGMKMLAQISADPAQLKAILGDDHLKITSLMRGDPPLPARPHLGLRSRRLSAVLKHLRQRGEASNGQPTTRRAACDGPRGKRQSIVGTENSSDAGCPSCEA